MSSTPESISFSVPHPKSAMKQLSAGTKLTVLGVAVPMFLVWVANWMAFSLAPFAAILNTLASKSDGKYPESMSWVLRLVGTLGFWGGTLFILLGIVIFVAAFLMMRMVFQRWMQQNTEIGHIALKSYLNAFFVFATLVGLFNLVLLVLGLNTDILSSLLGSLSSIL
jgi:hypothetical protein